MRNCPFPNCRESIPDENFACRKHWPTMPKEEREQVAKIWEAFRQGHMTAEQFQDAQDEVMESYKRNSRAEARLKQLAILVTEYAAKYKAYEVCKEQNLEAKRKLWNELNRVAKAMQEFAREVLHPKQKQGVLFDPENQTKLPD